MKRGFNGRLKELIQQAYVCKSGEHSYGLFERELAVRCCNGFVRFQVISGYSVERWLSEGDRPLEFMGGWHVVLVPDWDTETIERFNRRNRVWDEMVRNPTLQTEN